MASRASKRKQHKLTKEEAPVIKKCFSNLTNFVTSPNRKHKIDSDETVMSSKSGPALTSQPTMLLSQSGEILASQVSSQKSANEDLIHRMRNIKKVLEHKFKDVTERLQLRSTPPCLYEGNLKQCRLLHSTSANANFASNESRYLAKSIIAEDRNIQFIQYVRNNMCGHKEFPGVEVLRCIVELMLKIPLDKSRKPCITTQQILTELHSLFTSILITFPTCQYGSSYLQLLQSSFKVKGVLADAPVIHAMLELLSDLINHEDGDESKRHSDGHEQINNFYMWDAQNEAKCSFDKFKREEKLERIFLVLDALVQILESDLAMFLIRNSNHLLSSLNNRMHRPLICSVIWKEYESVMVINNTIKKIVTVFVQIIGADFPKSKVEVMSRLLNLVINVTNLYEYPDETFEYPMYKQRTTDLVQVIKSSIESSAFFSEQFFLRVTENIKSPMIKMLLANEILQKINNKPHEVSLKVPFDCIRDKVFNTYSSTVETKDARYKVTQKGYLKLLKIYAEAINDFFSIQDGVVDGESQEESVQIKKCNASYKSFDFRSFPEKLKEVDLMEKVQLRHRDIKFKKLTHVKMTRDRVEFYRTEIKHFILLTKLIPICQEKYNGKFDDWKLFIKKS